MKRSVASEHTHKFKQLLKIVAGDLVTLSVSQLSTGTATIWRYGASPHFGAHLVFAE